MSTLYYRLRKPFTLRLEPGTAHDRVTVFAHGANCGQLTFRPDETRAFLRLFRDEVAVVTFYGGQSRGTVIETQVKTDPDEQLVSDDGECRLLTYKELLALVAQEKAGAQ